MGTYHVSQSAEIPASAQAVYAILCDYHEAHDAILPKPYFEKMTVVEGGYGDGTVVTVDMNVFGARRQFTLAVKEIEKNHKLFEEDPAAGIATTFTIESLSAEQCKVTISSDTRAAEGFAGIIERWMNPPITRHIYKKELQNLVAYVNGEM